MVKTGTKRLLIKSKLLAFLLLTIAIQPAQAEPRINANNEAYFQDLTAAQAHAHPVENITYGEALFLMHSDQDLRALVTLQQIVELGQPLGLYPNLLRASIASKQGIFNIANNAIAQAKIQSQTTDSQYDLDRLFQFQAELAYEKGNMELLSESLANITYIEDLPDPEAIYFLRIQSSLAQDHLESAEQALSKMALSPWKAFAQVNIALWLYRKNNFEPGIELLNTALTEIDQTIELDAYEYWYATGRLSALISTPEKHLQQQDELTQLTEKVLTLIGYGHLKVLDNAAFEIGSPQFEDRLTQAQNAIFQIPQKSIYAHQGLELLAQALIKVHNAAPQESLFKNKEALDKKTNERKQHLQSLLTTLAETDKPMLTRLRSEFALITLSATENNDQEFRAVNSLLKTLTKEIESREQLLSQPQAAYETMLGYFYSNLGTHNLAEFKLAGLPVHKSLLVQWLSLQSTQEYIKTLKFFEEGLAFSKEWYAYKQTIEAQAAANQNQENHTTLQARLMQKQALLQVQLNEANKSFSKGSLDLATQTETDILTKIQVLNSTIDSLEQGRTQEKKQLEFLRGQIIWQQALLEPQRKLRLQTTLNQLRDSLAENQFRVSTLNAKPSTPRLDKAEVDTFNNKILALDSRVTKALEDNKYLFIESFKHHIRLEQNHLQAAIIKLKLKQAMLVQNAGVENE